MRAVKGVTAKSAARSAALRQARAKALPEVVAIKSINPFGYQSHLVLEVNIHSSFTLEVIDAFTNLLRMSTHEVMPRVFRAHDVILLLFLVPDKDARVFILKKKYFFLVGTGEEGGLKRKILDIPPAGQHFSGRVL